MSTTGRRRTLSEAEMLAGQRLPVVLRVTAATTRVTNESSQMEPGRCTTTRDAASGRSAPSGFKFLPPSACIILIIIKKQVKPNPSEESCATWLGCVAYALLMIKNGPRQAGLGCGGQQRPAQSARRQPSRQGTRGASETASTWACETLRPRWTERRRYSSRGCSATAGARAS